MESNLRDLFASKNTDVENNKQSENNSRQNLSIDLENSEAEKDEAQQLEINEKQENKQKYQSLELQDSKNNHQNNIQQSENNNNKILNISLINSQLVNQEQQNQKAQEQQKGSIESLENSRSPSELNSEKESLEDLNQNNQENAENSKSNVSFESVENKEKNEDQNQQQKIMLSSQSEININNQSPVDQSPEESKSIVIKEEIKINENYVGSFENKQNDIQKSQVQQAQEEYDFSINQQSIEEEQKLQKSQSKEQQNIQTEQIDQLTEEMFEKYDIDDDDLSDSAASNPPKSDQPQEFNSLNINQENEFKKQIFSSQEAINNVQVNEFLNGRDLEIQEHQSKKDWLIFEKRIYKLQSFKLINNEKTDVIETERGYRDFCWLFKYLQNEFKGIIVPPIPEKNTFSKLNKKMLDAQTLEFLERRKSALIIFLKKIIQHPILQNSQILIPFFSEPLFKFDLIRQNIGNQKLTSILTFFKLGGSKLLQTIATPLQNFLSFVPFFKKSTNDIEKLLKQKQPTKEDIFFSNFLIYFQHQNFKINECYKAVNNIFVAKQQELEGCIEMLENQKSLSYYYLFLQLKFKFISEFENQEIILNQLIQQIQYFLKTQKISVLIPLNQIIKEENRHLIFAIDYIKKRNQLSQEMFANKYILQELKDNSQELEQIHQLELQIQNDEINLSEFQSSLKHDLELFQKASIKTIKNIFESYKILLELNSKIKKQKSNQFKQV